MAQAQHDVTALTVEGLEETLQDAFCTIDALSAENARLDAALADTAAQLTDAVQENADLRAALLDMSADESGNAHLWKATAKAAEAAAARLRQERDKAREHVEKLVFHADIDAPLRPTEGFYAVPIQEYISLQDAKRAAFAWFLRTSGE